MLGSRPGCARPAHSGRDVVCGGDGGPRQPVRGSPGHRPALPPTGAGTSRVVHGVPVLAAQGAGAARPVRLRPGLGRRPDPGGPHRAVLRSDGPEGRSGVRDEGVLLGRARPGQHTHPLSPLHLRVAMAPRGLVPIEEGRPTRAAHSSPEIQGSTGFTVENPGLRIRPTSASNTSLEPVQGGRQDRSDDHRAVPPTNPGDVDRKDL